MTTKAVCDHCGTGVPPEDAEAQWWHVVNEAERVELEFCSPRCVREFFSAVKERLPSSAT